MFVAIKSQEELENFNFRSLMRLFLDPDYTNKHWSRNETPIIRHSDIVKETMYFTDEMNRWTR